MKKLLSLFLILVSLPAYSAVDSNQVERAEKYLNSITGLSGNFTQIANGKKDSGDFSMLRPGRVRLDYSSLPVQLIADGKDLYFFDKSLDQITTVPLTSTPAGILIRKHIDLRNSDITVSDTQTDAKTFSLKMHLRNNEGVGNMTVVFDNDPVRLDSWTVVDATGTKTQVVFNGLKTKTDFGKNYFQIQRHKTVSVAGGDSYYD
ncbi:MAG: outer membrane lipoprotein carrier protein LolA [Alphaproteobacteria bacterium]|jgi:outer membrane lipoprotein-sorting protein|nr:outer membrane lipoprotein carrier protein LolA [Alphaproteobacteria bacterium]